MRPSTRGCSDRECHHQCSAARHRPAEFFFAQAERNDGAAFEFDGEGVEFFERGRGDDLSDLGAERVAVLGFAEAEGELLKDVADGVEVAEVDEGFGEPDEGEDGVDDR